MYHSYLRGKQFELLAVRYVIDKIAESNSTPIIEPVRQSSRDILKCIEVLEENNSNYIIVSNPKVGELANNSLAREQLLDGISNAYPNAEFGVIVNDTSTNTDINIILDRYPQHSFSIIHFGQFQDIQFLQELSATNRQFKKHIFIEHCSSNFYQSQFSGFERVLIDDCFNRRSTNREYRAQLEEFFTDLHVNYTNRGFQGYGDFSVVGDYFSEGGGQAITAALHITFDKPTLEIYIRHFLSAERQVADEVPILLEEAISELEAFIRTKPEILEWSTSLNEVLEIYQSGCQTSLAYIKKLSIAHHFELMHKVLING
ncbi:sce7725 family protein [Pseudoalteromonas sp. MMG024]|uniref:sce7725 family protein n=1 Tax=Pseudoalteromonas sp. MMG024 TaxID=2909980 RepID=UPI001F246330|nr:sce7725 family protein [Pseudoalteromonas sp. MMG024]MCF6459187.1 sce7725 family protein [Pseudoalteromonas sp. MMG024]